MMNGAQEVLSGVVSNVGRNLLLRCTGGIERIPYGKCFSCACELRSAVSVMNV